MSVLTQAMLFLVFGVVLSAVIAVFVPASFFGKALPKQHVLAVPIASAAGVVLPGCECASVPVAGALVRRGITLGAPLAFLLASPALNPVVLTATVVAFLDNPEMVVGLGLVALVTATVMGWLWHARAGRLDPAARPLAPGRAEQAGPHSGSRSATTSWPPRSPVSRPSRDSCS